MTMTAREAALKCAEIAEQWRDGELAAEHIRAFAATLSDAPIPASSDAARELLREAAEKLRDMNDKHATDVATRLDVLLANSATSGAGAVPEEWKELARDVIRGMGPEDYGRWSAMWRRISSHAEALLDAAPLPPVDPPNLLR